MPNEDEVGRVLSFSFIWYALNYGVSLPVLGRNMEMETPTYTEKAM